MSGEERVAYGLKRGEPTPRLRPEFSDVKVTEPKTRSFL